jgi:hypothetical protein
VILTGPVDVDAACARAIGGKVDKISPYHRNIKHAARHGFTEEVSRVSSGSLGII